MLEINISQLFAQQQAETCRVFRGITSFVQGWGTPVVNWNPNDDKDPIAVLSAAQTQHLRDGLSSQVEPPTSIDPKVLSLSFLALSCFSSAFRALFSGVCVAVSA